MNEDEIAERIAGRLRFLTGQFCHTTFVSNWLDDAEAYRLAFVADVRERAKVRRQQKRVRAQVFARLGVADRAVVEK